MEDSSMIANLSTTCQYEKMEHLQAKFWLICVFGGTLSIAGIIANAVLLKALLKTSKNESYWIYLISLSVVDVGILVTYLLVMCVNIIYDYTENVILYFIWLQYVPYLFTLSRILTLISTYIVIVCSCERYLSVLRIKGNFAVDLTSTRRRVLIGLIFVFSFLFRAVSFWEVEITYRQNCTDFAAYGLTQTDLVRNTLYQNVYCVIAVQTVQTFLPFFVLVIVNFLIISQWQDIVRNGSQKIFVAMSVRKHVGNSTAGFYAARRMMVALITTYLIVNSLNLTVTIWEHVDKSFLEAHSGFYTFIADMVSLLTAFNSATRLGIYFACNKKIRRQVEVICAQMDIRRISTRLSVVTENFLSKSNKEVHENDAVL